MLSAFTDCSQVSQVTRTPCERVKRTVIIIGFVLHAHRGADPVVIDRLIGFHDDTVTLTSVDIQKVDG